MDNFFRFEQEIGTYSGAATYNQMPRGQPGGPGPGFQFIPHSLQRNMPPPRPAMNSVPPPNQPHHHLHQQMAAGGHHLLPQPQMHSQVVNTPHGPVINMDASTAGTSNPTGTSSKTKGKGRGSEHSKKRKNKKNLRTAGGTVWEDTTLNE